MLEVKNLSVSYGQHRALDNISVQIAKGEVVVILGANGAGKSSLLRAIAGLLEGHCEGDISFEGVSLLGRSPDEIVTDGIVLVPEGRAIFGDLNVEENLLLGAYNERAREKELANLDRVLNLFPKLRERRRQITRTMSGGEQQMVAVGRALMSDPAILMLDEPSLGLSPLLSKELFQVLSLIRETGPGVLVVEQNAKLSLAIADRGYLIENGQIVGANDAASLSANPAIQAAYLGGKPGASAGQSIAPEAGQALDRVFVTPAGLDSDAVNTTSLIGENLDGLLGRAADAAKPSGPPALKRPSPSDRVNRVIDFTPQHEQSTPALKKASRNGTVGGDDRIAAMLADFEAVAERARHPRPDGGTQTSVGQGPSSQDSSGDLPKIPVFRKSLVEVFKRDKSGKLVKAMEV